jgi:hypothetical protein
VPINAATSAAAYTAGDEAAVFGHTFTEDYWTNSSIPIKTANANATLTASFVHVGEFQAFLIAFNEINTANETVVMPYQLFGMHYKTPANKEVFIGAIFAFLLVHNETYGSNNLPDIGHENAWYIVPITSHSPWNVTAEVEAIPATLVEPNHYRFGMRYTNLTARVVSATGGFWLSLLLPLVTVLFSEITIQYDITISSNGTVKAQTLYTIGQVTHARILGFEVPPSSIIQPTMEISAVHYLSVFTSKYNVTRSTDGNKLVPPTATTPLTGNISIRVGSDSERAFHIGLGETYALYNETTDPWALVGDNYQALNCLLGARASDFLLIAWQAPLSAFLFAHMAYGLSTQLRATYSSVQDMANHVATAFHNSDWWYAVTFPTWHGLRVQQDPTYVAYTNLGNSQTGTSGIIIVGVIVIAVIALAVFARRR